MLSVINIAGAKKLKICEFFSQIYERFSRLKSQLKDERKFCFITARETQKWNFSRSAAALPAPLRTSPDECVHSFLRTLLSARVPR